MSGHDPTTLAFYGAEAEAYAARARAAASDRLGAFLAALPAGAEGRDRFGRYYNYPSPAWLRAAYDPVRWDTIDIVEGRGGGYDQEPTDWLYVTAIKSG